MRTLDYGRDARGAGAARRMRAALVMASALLFVLFLVLSVAARASSDSPGFIRLVDTRTSEVWPRGIVQVRDGELDVIGCDADLIGWHLSAKLSHLMIATAAWPVGRAVRIWRRRERGPGRSKAASAAVADASGTTRDLS